MRKEEAWGEADARAEEEVEAQLQPLRDAFAALHADAGAVRAVAEAAASGAAAQGAREEAELRALREYSTALEEQVANEEKRSEFLAARVAELEARLAEGGAPVDVLESWRTGLGFGALEPPEPRERGKGPRVVRVTVVAASHLPKMDVMGKCDPFCKLLFEGQAHATAVRPEPPASPAQLLPPAAAARVCRPLPLHQDKATIEIMYNRLICWG